MRILLACNEIKSLTGSPMYNLALAKELGKTSFVSLYTSDDKEFKFDSFYDLVILSQPKQKNILGKLRAKKIINVIHSEYEYEDPIIDPRIDAYIAIRPSIKKHLVDCHGIPAEMIYVIYNGIDMERFYKRVVNSNDYIKVVLPCTIDNLREPFLKYYVNKANKSFRVYQYGKKHIDIPKNEYFYIHDEVKDIENYIGDADIVAGIFLGRVNLEARAMGIPSIIHNADNPEEKQFYFPKWDEFKDRHDIINVAKKIIKLYERICEGLGKNSPDGGSA